MSKKEIKRFVDLLTKHIDRAIAKGAHITKWTVGVGEDGKFQSSTQQVCLLGSVLLGHKYTEHYREAAAKRIGLTKDEAYEVEAGFMYEARGNQMPGAYFEIGKKVKERLQKRGMAI